MGRLETDVRGANRHFFASGTGNNAWGFGRFAFLQVGFGFGEVVDGKVVAGAGGWFGSGDQEGLAETGGVGGGDVGAAVADHDGLGEVDAQLADGAAQHAGARLAVFVLPPPLADAVFGVVGAVVDGVEGDVFAQELLAHPLHQGFEVCGSVEAAGDSGLIGDDDQLVAERLRGAAEREDAVDEAHVGGLVEVADLVVDDSVAV
jgi:hypothetical protein